MKRVELPNRDFKSYNTISKEIRNQIDNVVDVWKKYLGDDLTGIYLHGSMCLDNFVESSSDIDLLIVTDRRIPREERLQIAGELIEIDGKPCPIEMSAIYTGDLKPWHHPVICQFHYSDFWTERYKQTISGEITENYVADNDFEDADVTSYIHLINQSGVVLYGKPIQDVFPEVPEKDFWEAISCEADDYDFNAYNPRYFVSNILILGRILSYKGSGRVLSKFDGGLWTSEHVPQKYRYIIENAMRVWFTGAELIEYDQKDLDGLKDFLINEIKK